MSKALIPNVVYIPKNSTRRLQHYYTALAAVVVVMATVAHCPLFLCVV